MPELLKHRFFQEMFHQDLAGAFKQIYPPFDTGSFLARIYDDEWENRELKGRMRHTTITLHSLLPEDYRVALDMLRRVAPMLDSYGFELLVFSDYVEVYGLDDWEVSIPALEQFTQQASAEFAVRPFILQDQDRMMTQMLQWSQHESYHVRRLASEGCRPRLPWGSALAALKADPAPILPILENLKSDDSEAVRRSVANNLNDVSKDNPQVTIDVLREWHRNHTREMQWIICHALRTLVKAGNPEALEILGYRSNPAIVVSNLVIEPDTIELGEELTFAFDLEAVDPSPQNLMIDYVVHLVRSNGRQTPKVFKLTRKTLAPGETLHISKKHSFRPVTTRKYYPGTHAIDVQINGARFAGLEFEVT